MTPKQAGTDSQIRAHAQHLASLIRKQFELPDLVPALYRLVAAGQPVTIDQLATYGGWSSQQVRAELAHHPGVDWDDHDHDRVLGFGLTLPPTPHRFAFDGRTVYAFCASDALMFPVLLGRPGRIESTCPATAQPIHVDLTPDAVAATDPARAVVTRIRPDHAVTDVRSEICSLGNFFHSPDAATEWLNHTPHGTVVTVEDDFLTTRLAAIDLGWTTT